MLSATNTRSLPAYDEVYTYDRGGRMRSKGQTVATAAAYAYGGAGVPFHAPASVAGTALAYDANGNMTLGLGGKAMAYDRENRPLAVTFGTRRTCYVYGADGARLKKIENLAANQNCAVLPPTAPVTLYIGAAEIRDFRGAGEQILTYPHPKLRLVHSAGSPVAVNYLHGDHLGSLRAVTDVAGAATERATYRPYGVQTETVLSLAPNETKGFIGERYDADAGLQYLNARYYDPALALFVQPDWFPVMQAGVGTNRYSYAFNDPVNLSDPGGNSSAGNNGLGPRDDPGSGGGASGGDGGLGGGRELTGFDRFVAGALGWDVDALPAYEGLGIGGSGRFGEFQAAYKRVFTGGLNDCTECLVAGTNWLNRQYLTLMNPAFVSNIPTLAAIWASADARAIMWDLLQQSGYNTNANAFYMLETGGWFTYDAVTGAVSFHNVRAQKWNGIYLGVPPPGTHVAHVHTHPSYIGQSRLA